MTVAECMRRMGGGEFLRWKVYFDEELNAFHREDYMLARIAQVIRQGQVKPENAASVKLADMLVEFTTNNTPIPPPAPAMKLQNSKNFWLGLLGTLAKPRKPPTPPHRG